MSTDKRSGFGNGFSRDVEAVLTARTMGLIYDNEARENLRIAGMVLMREAVMPEFDEPETEEFDPTEGDPDE